MAGVFISYSRKDQAFVRKLHAALEEHERDAWVDWEGIPPVDKWLATIHSAIDEADAFLFVISPDSVASDVCGIELDHAVKQHKRLIPIVHRDPTADTVPKELAELNYIFARESDAFDTACEVLIAALDTDLEWTRDHTRLLVRTTEWVEEGRDASFTLRGRDLSDFEDWLAKSPDKEPKPTTLQSEHLLASRRAVTRRQQLLWGSLAVGLSIAVALATFSYFQNLERVRQETIAGARKLVNKADAYRAESAIRSTRFASKALATLHELGVPSLEADQALRKSFAALPKWTDFELERQSVNASAFDAQGAYLALFLGRERLMVWDTAQQQEVGTCSQPLQAMRSALAVAVTSDGAHAAAAIYLAEAPDRTELTVWSMRDCSRRLHVQVPGREDRIALSESGDYLLLKMDQKIRVWDVASRAEQPIAFASRVREFAVSPDSRRLATLEFDLGPRMSWVRIRDLDTKKVLREWRALDTYKSMQWRGQVLVLNARGKLTSHDAESGQLLRTHGRGSTLSPDARRIAVLASDTIAIRDSETEVELSRTFHESAVGSLAFGPDSESVIVVGMQSRRIRTWMFRNVGGSFALPEYGPVAGMGFTADSSRLYTTAREGSRAWLPPATGQLGASNWQRAPGESLPQLDAYEIESVKNSDSSMGPATIALRAVRSEGEPRTITVTDRTLAASISRKGDRLAVMLATGSTRGGWERSLQVWDTAGGTLIAGREFGPVLDADTASYLELVGDDRLIAIGTRVGVELVEAEGLETVATLFHPNVILTAASGNGELAASMGRDHVVRIWELASGDELARIEAAGDVSGLALSNDRRWLATLEGPGTVRLWALAPEDLIQQACHWVGADCP